KRVNKPIIGITSIYYGTIEKNKMSNINFVDDYYTGKIYNAGGIPMMMPVRPSLKEDAFQIARKLDGLVLSGGTDLHPIFYDEEPVSALRFVDTKRDEFEMALAKAMLELAKPIFGICRGIQLLNVILGGDLHQDLQTQLKENSIQHMQMTRDRVANHSIHVSDDSFLFDIYGEKGFVNSYHHQGIRTLGEGLKAVAWSKDRVVEAVEYEKNKNVFAVQWHPEVLEDEPSQKLFDHFIKTI
ncbi:MAG TPA: hypothetical protein DHN33_09475, partial [Eubacteriaceae bacterium]|nr:hypothetical protein [Eubacteriaceae bacterium]